MQHSPAVDVRGLVKRYNEVDVVDRLNLTAHRGEITAVLGPNGAGKTTTIECCEGLRVPDGGSVRVLGVDPIEDARALQARVGVMLQDGGLPTGVRALEMLEHVARMYADPREVSELTARLGLKSFARTTVRRLSGGQRQRLALAIAIVGRPELVFLDEPSAGMDPQSRHAVWDLMRELRADGVSIVLTTHLMDEAASLADRVVIVDRGRVIAEGTVDELTSGEQDGVLTVTASAPLEFAELEAHLHATHSASLTVTPVQAEGFEVTGPVDPQVISAVSAWFAREDLLIRSLEFGGRTLEDVFLDLTGRNLR